MRTFKEIEITEDNQKNGINNQLLTAIESKRKVIKKPSTGISIRITLTFFRTIIRCSWFIIETLSLSVLVISLIISAIFSIRMKTWWWNYFIRIYSLVLKNNLPSKKIQCDKKDNWKHPRPSVADYFKRFLYASFFEHLKNIFDSVLSSSQTLINVIHSFS